MHTLTATVAGLIDLAVLLGIERMARLPGRSMDTAFVVFWLLATVAHGQRGVAAGQTVLTEVVVGLVVFGVPLAALIAVRAAARRRAPRRSIFTS